MNESILEALMRLFALVAKVDQEGKSSNEKEIVTDYLRHHVSSEMVIHYLKYFEEHVAYYHPELLSVEHDVIHGKTLDQRLNLLCEQLNEELQQHQKILVIINLLDFISHGKQPSEFEIKFLDTLSEKLKISEQEYLEIKAFTFDEIDKINDKENLLFINSDKNLDNKEIKHIRNELLEGTIKVLRINSSNNFVLRYYGSEILHLHGHTLKPAKSYIWSFGGVIKNPKIGSIYYTWMAGKFIQDAAKQKFVFKAENIAYSYGNSPNGIRPFTLTEESGRLIGIIGGSGSGKSTLLKLLNGNLKPKQGKITINGFDIHENKEELKGLIGYVPQDDTIIKELTVFENLYFNAKLCFKDYSEEQLKQVVEDSLVNFDLFEARDLQVGDSLNTFLSGGQRKRLNIALELMREPLILFADEPTSGLSSADSEKVMLMLKRQTFKGKLIFANIHQPSSDVYRLIDKLLVIDQGGRIVYYGNPVDAISYFKKMNHHVDPEQNECKTCGNINSDEILKNIEARVVDVNGRLTRKRKTSPEDWYQLYLKNVDPIIKKIHRPFKKVVPKSDFNTPTRLQQMLIYLKRDILSKIANKQYLLLTLLEAPVLAIILSFIAKSTGLSSHASGYRFIDNPNIPGFLFMSVIVALFLGMVISSEEIFKDKKLLEREKFLNLSRFSYLNAKILMMILISAIQIFVFVAISHLILDIHGMIFRHFLILFTAACWANLIGLNISSGFNSVVTIYILIPIILVPQILFSGVVIDFHNMNESVKAKKYVPVIGDMITARWTYEALAVTQFKHNKFNKFFFKYDREKNITLFDKVYRIPLVKSMAHKLSADYTNEAYENYPLIIKREAEKLENRYKSPMLNVKSQFLKNPILEKNRQKFISKLDSIAILASKQNSSAIRSKEKIYEDLKNKLGGNDAFAIFRSKYQNTRLANLVLNSDKIKEYIIVSNEVVPLSNPVYHVPDSKVGRAHFFASSKRIGNFSIDTFWFNILRVWFTIAIWFTFLYLDLLYKIISYFESIKLRRRGKRRFLRLF